MAKRNLDELSPEEIIRLSEETTNDFRWGRIELYIKAMKKYEERGEKGKAEDMKREALIFNLTIHVSPSKRFKPRFKFKDENGKERESPDWENDFPLESITYYKKRVEQTSNPILKARYTDFLWEHEKDFNYAKLAVEAYLECTSIYIDKGWDHELSDALDRALSISWEINNTDLTQKSVRFHYDCISKLIEIENPRYILEITASILKRAKRLKPPPDYNHLISASEKAIEYYAENEVESFNLQQGFMERLVEIYKLMGNDQKVRDTKIRIAESFIEEAEWKKENYPSGNSVAATFYEKAMQAYINIGGFQEKVEELKKKIKEAHKAAVETEFHMMSIPVEIDKETLDNYQKVYKGRKPLEVFQLLISDPHLMPSFESAKKTTIKHAKEFVFMHLVSQTKLQPREHIRVKTYSTDDERFYFFTLQNFMMDYQFKARFLLTSVYRVLKEEHPTWVDEMVKYLKTLPLVEENRIKIIEQGLRAFDRGDYVSAIHVLVFQIEGILRDFVGKLGISTFSYPKGEMRVKKLWEIMDILLNVKDIDKDILMLIRTFLVDIGGENLRNNLAHGILEYDSFTGLSALLLIYILLKITPYETIKKEKPQSEKPNGRKPDASP